MCGVSCIPGMRLRIRQRVASPCKNSASGIEICSKVWHPWQAVRGKVDQGLRVVRGGAWNNNAENLRVANRNRNAPDNRNDNIGFRCVARPPSNSLQR